MPDEPLTPNIDVNQQNAQLEHERLNSLINSMADAVIAVDETNSIVLYNAATLNLFDINNITPNMPIADLFKPVDANNQPVDISTLISQIKTSYAGRDLRIHFDDGSVTNLYTSIAPVHLGYGKNGGRGFVILLRDITREKSLEEEREEFISVVSHELRTPITIAEGNISNAQLIAQKNQAPDNIKQALNEAHKQVLFLADMVNDLSTLSRAERNKLKVEIESINVNDLISELAQSYGPDAQKKSLQIIGESQPNLPPLMSSRLYVREILQNFVTNAIKYTQNGSVKISAEIAQNGITFKVSDTGIGISKTDQEKVFDKFFRSEDFRTREANGTGLGLYVTMKLANLLHAKIDLTSELNKGSTFSIFIPNLQ